jgi:pimeloyl-ACP methyl ester carboxylesterase
MPETVGKHKVRDVNVRIMRRGSGPPLLFLHGANGLPVWLPMFDMLSKEFEVIVPEHPGFGLSDNPSWIRNVGDLAMYYLDFLDGLGPYRVHLVGLSLGGWTAAEIAVRNCSRLASLSLLAPAGVRVKGIPAGDNFIWGKFGWEPRWFNPSLERWLHRISVPTLVLWGQDDKLFPSAYAAPWGERIAGSRVEIIPECGHGIVIEKPERAAKEIMRLIAGTR